MWWQQQTIVYPTWEVAILDALTIFVVLVVFALIFRYPNGTRAGR